MAAGKHLMDWLRDAHAMEEQSERMLTNTAARIKNYPEFKARLESHAEETRRQVALLKGCIDRRGGDTSAVKDLAGRLTAMAQAASGMFVSDEIVKATMATYTFEHMEISAYRSLIGAAEAVGDAETKRVCEEILAQEEAMAEWVGGQLAPITRLFLERDEAPKVTAKH